MPIHSAQQEREKCESIPVWTLILKLPPDNQHQVTSVFWPLLADQLKYWVLHASFELEIHSCYPLHHSTCVTETKSWSFCSIKLSLMIFRFTIYSQMSYSWNKANCVGTQSLHFSHLFRLFHKQIKIIWPFFYVKCGYSTHGWSELCFFFYW